MSVTRRGAGGDGQARGRRNRAQGTGSSRVPTGQLPAKWWRFVHWGSAKQTRKHRARNAGFTGFSVVTILVWTLLIHHTRPRAG